jgi:hypothetical protein
MESVRGVYAVRYAVRIAAGDYYVYVLGEYCVAEDGCRACGVYRTGCGA